MIRMQYHLLTASIPFPLDYPVDLWLIFKSHIGGLFLWGGG